MTAPEFVVTVERVERTRHRGRPKVHWSVLINGHFYLSFSKLRAAKSRAEWVRSEGRAGFEWWLRERGME